MDVDLTEGSMIEPALDLPCVSVKSSILEALNLTAILIGSSIIKQALEAVSIIVSISGSIVFLIGFKHIEMAWSVNQPQFILYIPQNNTLINWTGLVQ